HRCKTSAVDDLAAVHAWLSRQRRGSHTWRAYRREVERFLLWSVFARGKSMSSLDAADCAAFRDFLTAPGVDWTSPRHVPRWSNHWRPLEGGLSPASTNTAITIVRNLCGWLAGQRYLDANPWDDVSLTPSLAMPGAHHRSLSVRDGELLQQWLASRPPSRSFDRLRVLFSVAGQTGLRESELAAARTGWLHSKQQADGPRTWFLTIPDGRGPASSRTIDLPDGVAAQLLQHLAYSCLPESCESTGIDRPLFAHRDDPEKPLTPGRIYTMLKVAFGHCADTLEATDPESADRIRRASTHWLRHTHAMHSAAVGMPLEALQQRLGHRALATTAVYLCGTKRGSIDVADGGAGA
ncbi:MAG: site-specific integrase, partial [Pseudomonadota bacterium]|nr:site-specific integrase [Pseudomonadota bacterium]